MMKQILDLFIDANVMLAVTCLIWWGAGSAVLRTRLRHDYVAQLGLLKGLLTAAIISPAIAFGLGLVGRGLWPEVPMTASDLAVALYLNGSIALPAVEFESLLNLRHQAVLAASEGELPGASLFFGLLALGVALQLVRTILSVLRVRRAIAGSYLWRSRGRVQIRFSDTVGVPFAARGLLTRYVILPSDLATRPEELRLIIAHELQHLRKGDVEWDLAFELMRPLFFLNPAYYLLRRAFHSLRELACDQAVVLRRRVGASDYMACLLDFCDRRLDRPTATGFHVAFVRQGRGSARRALVDRVRAVESVRLRRRSRFTAPLTMTGLVLASVLVATVLRQPSDWSHDRLMLATIVNLERLEAINRGY